VTASDPAVSSYTTSRDATRKFGSEFARKLRRRWPKPGHTWHLDEVFLRINGVLHYLWRAVDQHGVVLDILVQDRRSGNAAKRFFRRLLAGLKYKPWQLETSNYPSLRSLQSRIAASGCDVPLLTRLGHRLRAAGTASHGALGYADAVRVLSQARRVKL
jgi:transposase-like protein